MDARRLFGTLLSAIFLLSTSAAVAVDQNAPAAQSAMTGNGEDVGFGQSCCCPRWSATADFIVLDRLGSASQTLVSTYPPHTPLVPGAGIERLNSNNLNQGFAGGPRLSLTGHGDRGYDFELLYFQIDGWSSVASIAPNYIPGGPPPNWLVFEAPGGFVQLTDDPDQSMAWTYATRLYNAELNVRWNPGCRVTVLAGFRWVNLSEDLQGTLPPQRAAPFWDTNTRNNLYGFQIGADGKLFERGRFSIDGLVKAGIFDDHVDEATMVSIDRIPFRQSASTNHAAFVGETGLQCKYRVTPRLSLQAAYQAIWLQGVALAPGQIAETYSHYHPIYIEALGVNCNSSVFFHGATAGLEYAF